MQPVVTYGTTFQATARLTDASGPDHERSFRIEVWIDGELLGRGEGPSRRAAETAAAAQALEQMLTTESAARGAPDGDVG